MSRAFLQAMSKYVPLVEFMYLVFTRIIMAGESCHNRFRSVCFVSRDVFLTLECNTIQLYCLCVEKCAFWLVIYIKHSIHLTIKHQQLNETRS